MGKDCGGCRVPRKDESGRKWLKAAALVGTLGTDMVLFAWLGFWLGQAADERWGWFPWGTSLGTLLGFIVAFWSICRLLSDRR